MLRLAYIAPKQLYYRELGSNRESPVSHACSPKPAIPERCLIDLIIGLPSSRWPRVVFEVIGRLCQPVVQAFMIAAGRSGLDVSVSDTRLEPRRSGRDHPGMAVREEIRQAQTQRNSVSCSQSEWSRIASLRATAVRARLVPLVSSIRLPHSRNAKGRWTRDSTTLATS